MSDIDEYLSLPEDPELAFVEFEKKERQAMWETIRDVEDWSFVRDGKTHYISRVMGFHDAHEFQFLNKPILSRHNEEFDNNFDEFIDDITRITTEISVRHARRLRPIHTILELSPEIKKQIRCYIEKIREFIVSADLSEFKKEAIFGKLNALSDEIDRDRTKAEALMALSLEVGATAGKVGNDLAPVRKLIDSISNLFAKAKEMGEAIGLPSPRPKPRIEPPRKELPKPNDHGDLDNDIPF